jgi:cellulose synthase/poly-beta-1,6-N-acetylglucosamine synthase-like glycosyltransferase
MMLGLYILFALVLFCIFWTYILYPVGMIMISGKRESIPETKKENLPEVEIIFAAYNEASVIKQKLLSIVKGDYPLEKIRISIGSDNSTDKTDDIITEMQGIYACIHLQRFSARTGKTGIINALVARSKTQLILLTDANIIFKDDTIVNLVNTKTASEAGIVGGNIIYRESNNVRGISQQEATYLNLENKIKHAESMLFGKAMGVEGGCYLIERKLFPLIPSTFFMEDFFVSMHVLEQGRLVLFEPKAVVYEDVSTEIKEEYKRKIRISIGNFQNLGHYKHLIFKRFCPLGLLFLSHKILRWLTPFFLILLAVLGSILSLHEPLFQYFMLLYAGFFTMALMGILFSQRKGMAILKFPGHFFYMNLALLHGFIKYTKGIKSNVWQPTKRNQS